MMPRRSFQTGRIVSETDKPIYRQTVEQKGRGRRDLWKVVNFCRSFNFEAFADAAGHKKIKVAKV